MHKPEDWYSVATLYKHSLILRLMVTTSIWVEVPVFSHAKIIITMAPTESIGDTSYIILAGVRLDFN